jgi:hypothetical protein
MFNLGYLHALLDQPVPTHLNRHAPGMPQHMRHPATTPCLLASAGALQHPNPATRGAEHRQALVDQHSTSRWCSRAVTGRRRLCPAGALPWFDQGAHGSAATALHPWQPGHLAAHIMLQGGVAGCWPLPLAVHTAAASDCMWTATPGLHWSGCWQAAHTCMRGTRTRGSGRRGGTAC